MIDKNNKIANNTPFRDWVFPLILIPLIFLIETMNISNILQAATIIILLIIGTIINGLTLTKRQHHIERSFPLQLESEVINKWDQYHSILESIPDLVIIHQAGKIKFVNSSGANGLGSNNPDTYIGKPIIDYIHPDSRKQVSERIHTLKEFSKLNSNGLKVINGNGDLIDIESTSTTIHYNNQQAVLTIVKNISTSKKAELERMNNEVKYRTLFEYANDAIYLFKLDTNGMPLNFIELNQVACIRFEYSKEELLKLTPLDITSEVRYEKVYETQQKLLDQGHITFEGEYISKSGKKIPSEINVRILTLNGEKLALAISRDISERKRAEEKIKHLAYYDRLTNIANRSYFRILLSQTTDDTLAKDHHKAILLIDLDRFKVLNDIYGHHIGDLLLIEVSKRLSNLITNKDLVARQGGDEFIILLHTNEQRLVNHLSEKISEGLSQPFLIEEYQIFITASIGISIYPLDGKDAETLIKNATIAMRVAKETSEYTYKYFSLAMNQKMKRKMLLETELRNVLERNELQLYYQPKINIHTNQLVGVEALLRWNSIKFGMVSPAEFIPIAEESGLITPIGEWVLKTACKQCKTWHDTGYPPIIMSINLSARQFQQNKLIQFISETLNETKLDPKYVNLEITETMAMMNIEESIMKLNSIKKLGVSISLDDFGTGYSSLSYLNKFPVDILKIDQSFIRNIIYDDQSAAIVKAIISVSKSLNLTVIAEGVETIEELNFLRLNNCDEVQGYYCSPPLTPLELEEILRGKPFNI